MNYKIKVKRLEIWQLILIFILLTIIGTLSHELAHFIVAKEIDLDPILHYGSISFRDDTISDKDFFISTIFGPFQTILTGTLGFIFLLYRKKIKKTENFSLLDWTLVFITLFWLRACFNLAKILFLLLFNKEYKITGDEAFISDYLGLPTFFFNILLGVVGFFICYYTVFKIIPSDKKNNLIIGGFLGCLIGFIIWFHFLGKIILP